MTLAAVFALVLLGAAAGFFLAGLLAVAGMADERAEWAHHRHRLEVENANLLEQLERQ